MSLLPPPSLSRISYSVFIIRRPHHYPYLVLSPSSCLSATSLLLLYRPPHISAAVSAAILIHRPCNLACLITLSSLTCVCPAILIHRHLCHPASLSQPSLLFYISAVSPLSLYPLSCISVAATLPSCIPDPSHPPVTTEQYNRGSWLPRSVQSGVCVLIGGTPSPFRSGNILPLYQAADVTVL